MRTLFLAAALAAFVTAPAFAGADTKAPASAAAEPTHEMCQSVMGKRMDGVATHDHTRDKTGAVYGGPAKRPLTRSEMRKMHRACAKKMAKAEAAAPAK